MDCKDPPCQDYKPCYVTGIEIKEQLRPPTNMGSQVVGIVSGGSCTGKGEADLSISYAKAIEETVELSLTDRADVDWSKSEEFNIKGMPAFWSFGMEIGGAWTSTQGGKRSVSETRTKSTGEQTTSASANSSPYRMPGAGLLVATSTQYKIDRSNVPVTLDAVCKVAAPKPKHCIYDGKDYQGPHIRKIYDHGPPNNFDACIEACEDEPECVGAAYAEFGVLFAGTKSACWLKGNMDKPTFGGRNLFHSLVKSVILYRCGEVLDASQIHEAPQRFDSTMDFESFSYGATHFSPMNTGKSGACSPDLMTCIKDIPSHFRSFFGEPNAAEKEFKACLAKYGKGGNKKDDKDKKNKKDKKKKKGL